MALLAVYVVVAWALSVGVAAVLEEALVSALASALALARQAFANPFSRRVWAQSVAIVSVPFVARSALQQMVARAARVVVVAQKNLTTRLTGAVR